MIEVERVKHMSVEEAIEVLVQDLPCETDEDLSEAMTMAIKALETVSCIKEKCAYCPHCENCDVDDETLEIKALEQQPCEMTVEEYRQRMIDAFHNADCDNLIALVALPSEKEFEHLEWLLKNHYHNQKQQPCEDAVSRADALKALDCDIKHYEFKKGVSKYMDDIVKLLDIIYVTQSNAIKALPPVTPKQQPCEDAVSRQAVHGLIAELLSDYLHDEDREKIEELDVKIEGLPSVTPKEKTGKWIKHQVVGHPHGINVRIEYEYYECSRCHTEKDYTTNFCPDCGARMVSE